jgi:uncharacterized DUF497 family protein
MLEFGWDDQKREANIRKHGIDFVAALKVFDDPFALDEEDRSVDYGEARRKTTGYAGNQLLAVIYTQPARYHSNYLGQDGFKS